MMMRKLITPVPFSQTTEADSFQDNEMTSTPSSLSALATDDRDIASARFVLEQEIKGLQALHDSLNGHFKGVVETIFAMKGRLIVSGMGKSGHIAKKIAATCASTGTPALYVHPAEASHGDLGMITKDDVVMLLSNSGETAELHDIIAFTRRFSIPLLAMVRRPTSTLVDAADVALVLPEIPEASPTGAPTTSTTMMLALGDAIAIALLEKRGFTREDFHVFHPGGKLGKRFIRVSDLMHGGDDLPLVGPETPMQEVLITMTAKRFGCAGVVDGQNHLLGIITDGDLRRHMSSQLLEATASEVMTANPKTIKPQALAAEALAVMNGRSITNLFVLEDNKPVGIIHVHDCLRAGVA
jgi:arabinose-5-phosphate isomerase